MKVILENRLIHGVPLLECYCVDDSLDEPARYEKPLLFFNHGFTSCKEDNQSLLIQLANHGMYVVAVDAFQHGERISQLMASEDHMAKEKELFNIVRTTAKDILYLFEHHYQQHFENYSVSGISLGGAVAYYSPLLSNSIIGIAPMIGFPSFVEFGKYVMQQNNIPDSYYESVVDDLAKDDPMNHINRFEGIKILMQHGKEDTVVPDTWTKQLHQLLVERGINEDAKLMSYDIGHDIDEKMIKDLLAWCVENLL